MRLHHYCGVPRASSLSRAPHMSCPTTAARSLRLPNGCARSRSGWAEGATLCGGGQHELHGVPSVRARPACAHTSCAPLPKAAAAPNTQLAAIPARLSMQPLQSLPTVRTVAVVALVPPHTDGGAPHTHPHPTHTHTHPPPCSSATNTCRMSPSPRCAPPPPAASWAGAQPTDARPIDQ